MRPSIARCAVFVAISVTTLLAQQIDTPVTAVPRLVRVSGAFHPTNGLPVGTTESATLSIYRDEEGGQPLWQETQNVSIDANGQYTAMLGITQTEGVPLDLFSAGEPRWLGVMFNRPGEMEQPRVQLVSVPYALRASDAETLGGRPASAYLLAPSSGMTGTPEATGFTATSTEALKLAKPKAITGTPTTNSIVKFTDSAGDIGNSIITDTGSLAVAGQAAIGSGHAPQTYGFDLYINGSNPTALIDAYGNPGTASLFLQGRSTSASNHRLSVNSAGLFSITPSSTGTPTLAISQSGILSLGTTTPWSGAKFQVHSGTNQNLALSGPLSLSNGVTLHSLNDAINANGGLEFRGSPIVFNVGNVGIGTNLPGSKLDVAGNINFSGALSYQGAPILQMPGGAANGNTAVGRSALLNNTSGTYNTATGFEALSSNTTGNYNTATGWQALDANKTGTNNTAMGHHALEANITGDVNTVMGINALYQNTSGNGNIAIGAGAGGNVVTGNNNIYIDSGGSSDESDTIRIGIPGTQSSFFAAGIYGVNSNGIPVYINSDGQLGTVSSSRRYKEDIQDMGDASNGLMRLRPVTFRYKKAFDDGSKPIQYGLIAEEVAEVYPDLVAHSADGQIETVKYQVLDSMLLNEVQKQQKEIQRLQSVVSEERDQNQSLQDRLARLESAIAKMASGAGSQ